MTLSAYLSSQCPHVTSGEASVHAAGERGRGGLDSKTSALSSVCYIPKRQKGQKSTVILSIWVNFESSLYFQNVVQNVCMDKT